MNEETKSDTSEIIKDILSEVASSATQTHQFDYSESLLHARRRSRLMNRLSPTREVALLPSTIQAAYSWDLALNEVLGVLRIQYRNDDDVMMFLNDPEKLRQLQYSASARSEWNRRVIKEEMDSGVHSPTRLRRIAKEVAIDYIRRYLDGEEERHDMIKRIQFLQNEKDENLSMVMDLEREIKKGKEEKVKLLDENAKLAEEVAKLQLDIDSTRTVNLKLGDDNSCAREENDRVRGENAKLREENKKLRVENQDLRNENGALRSENQKVRHDNAKLRDEAGDMRSENMKVRGENQAMRDENHEVRCENLKLRDNNSSLRSENDRFRTTNETLLNENRKIVRENLELHAREDEMRMMVNVQQSLLAGKVGSGERSEFTGGDGQADEDDC